MNEKYRIDLIYLPLQRIKQEKLQLFSYFNEKFQNIDLDLVKTLLILAFRLNDDPLLCDLFSIVCDKDKYRLVKQTERDMAAKVVEVAFILLKFAAHFLVV